jgi:hypothetical protein
MSERPYTLEDHERYRREVDAKEAKDREKASAYSAWVNAGGDPGSFEQEWPRLRTERAKARVLSADQEARQAQRNAGIGGI